MRGTRHGNPAWEPGMGTRHGNPAWEPGMGTRLSLFCEIFVEDQILLKFSTCECDFDRVLFLKLSLILEYLITSLKFALSSKRITHKYSFLAEFTSPARLLGFGSPRGRPKPSFLQQNAQFWYFSFAKVRRCNCRRQIAMRSTCSSLRAFSGRLPRIPKLLILLQRGRISPAKLSFPVWATGVSRRPGNRGNRANGVIG